MHSMNMYKYQYTASFKKIYVNTYSLQSCKKQTRTVSNTRIFKKYNKLPSRNFINNTSHLSVCVFNEVSREYVNKRFIK